MRWKNLLLGSAFVGVFSIGALWGTMDNSVSKLKAKELADPITTSQVKIGNSLQMGADQFVCPMCGVSMGSGARMGQYFSGTMIDVIADKLGMTVEELQDARYEGYSIAELAEERNIDVDELMDKMFETRKAELDQLVENGFITEEQKAVMLENMEYMMEAAIQRDTVGPMRGCRGQMGRGGRWGQDASNQSF